MLLEIICHHIHISFVFYAKLKHEKTKAFLVGYNLFSNQLTYMHDLNFTSLYIKSWTTYCTSDKKSLWSFDHSTLCSTYVCWKFVFIKQVTAHHTKNQAKGQFISKCLFGIFNSPKKRMKKFNFTTMVPQVDLFSFMFWENRRHQKDISKLTDL